MPLVLLVYVIPLALSLTHIMQLVVEPASVADGLAVVVPPPERGLSGLAVGAGGPFSSGGALLRGGREKKKRDVTLRFFAHTSPPSVSAIRPSRYEWGSPNVP